MDWGQLINQYGFPIAACLAMAWFVWYKDKNEREDRLQQAKMHKEEIDKLSNVINNNTIVIQKLVDKMEADK